MHPLPMAKDHKVLTWLTEWELFSCRLGPLRCRPLLRPSPSQLSEPPPKFGLPRVSGEFLSRCFSSYFPARLLPYTSPPRTIL